MASEIKYRR